MLRRAEADDLASSHGSFGRIGRVAVRWPLVVIGLWIALAVTLFLVLPPLAKIAGEKPPEFLPSDAPVLVANNAMIKEFNESDSQNSLLVVLTNDNGLGPRRSRSTASSSTTSAPTMRSSCCRTSSAPPRCATW